MISLKRNSRGELVPATGRRSTERSLYIPNQGADFRVSRSKFSDFLTCPRCFYLDRVKGLDEPGMPGWALNSATDELLKKEFDICRENQMPHRLFKEYGLEHLVPFKHEEMNQWRDALRGGILHKFEDTNIILSGGVDDIWLDTKTKELIVVDYKSQASLQAVEPITYLNNVYHHGYKLQLDFYNYLLNCKGYKTSPISYFLVVNANRTEEGFYGKMIFTETLIPYKNDVTWISSKIKDMIKLINQKEVPEGHESCENCAYARQRSVFDR
ncbi:PD-(D/E)XK endonuclease-like domain, AddAB-type [Candidatus Methylopumilus planktonicus]|uniref:PD-(D/E)XK nuclease family protein n=1 Tax=Candidatus Methylopumilus planktonicus TaxID=1581557 RepID=UPI003BEF38A4